MTSLRWYSIVDMLSCLVLILSAHSVPFVATGNEVIESVDDEIEISARGMPVVSRAVSIWAGSEPGTLVSTMDSYVGQRCEIVSTPAEDPQSFTTSDGATKLFTLLANGDLITIGDLSSVIETGSDAVSLAVTCRMGLLAWMELVHVNIVGGSSHVAPSIGFRQPSYEGRIDENSLSGTMVDGLQSIGVKVEPDDTIINATVGCTGSSGEEPIEFPPSGGDDDVASTTSGYETTASGFSNSSPFLETADSTPLLFARGSRAAISSLPRRPRKPGMLVVCYSIVAGPTGLFRLEPNTDGTVSVWSVVPLDYERQSQYVLTVRAEPEVETDRPTTTSLIHVRIYVNNVNDNVPRLDDNEYHVQFDIPQPLPVNHRPTGYDLDGDELSYFISDDDGFYCAHFFEIDSTMGTISARLDVVDEPLMDYFRNCRFLVFADDGIHRSEPAIVRVGSRVKVASSTDATTNSRTRREVRPLRQVEVPENMIGDVIDLNEATAGSPGLGRHQHEFYAFKDPAPVQLELNPLSGKIRVRPGERLDYEAQPEVNFVVFVTRIDDASGKYGIQS